jgi:hypothetical protein
MTSDTVKRGEAATSLRYKMMELASSRDDLISLGRGDPGFEDLASCERPSPAAT